MNGKDSAKPPAPPLWATLLLALGWVIAAASVAAGVASGFKLAAHLKARTDAETAAIVATSLAIGAIGIGIGMVLVTIARVGRPTVRVGRLLVWARLCTIVGIEFSAGLPLLIYGMMLLGLAFTHDPTAAPIDPLGGKVILMASILCIIPFVIGLAMIAAAWIWGRRKSINLSDVFS